MRAIPLCDRLSCDPIRPFGKSTTTTRYYGYIMRDNARSLPMIALVACLIWSKRTLTVDMTCRSMECRVRLFP